MQIKQFLTFTLILVSFILFGCGGSGGDSDAVSSASEGTGTLSLSLSDATTDKYQAVYITIAEVSVHKAGDDEAEESEEENGDESWITVATPNQTYNLLELVNGFTEPLGDAELESGNYTQMRLVLGEDPDSDFNLLDETHPYSNYVIESTDNYQELTVPSGYQSGIKIVQGYEIKKDLTKALILDFDASKSIVSAGNSGKLKLKPTIKIVDEDEIATLSGIVSEGGVGVGGVYVSVQTYDPDAESELEQVVVQSGTVTEDDGSYFLRLESGTYYVVAYKDGYEPVCAMIVSELGNTYEQNFEIVAASTTITISGSVSVTGGGNDAFVTLSFRQSADCGDTDTTPIEVKSVNVGDGGDYEETLPEETYTIVASTEDDDVQVEEEVSTGSVFDWDF
jgi:uncharacterized protein DUF4382